MLWRPALVFLGATVAVALAGAARGAPASAPMAAASRASAPASAPLRLAPIDLNNADRAALRRLEGITAERADAIVAGRPYAGTDELVSRRILPRAAYERIKLQITIARP